MLGNLHFNTETSLVLIYALVMIGLLLVLSLNLPYKAKKPLNDLVSRSLYYLGMAALLPLWTLLNAIRNLQRFSAESRGPNFPPMLIEKHKGRIIKCQRNLIMSLFAIICYVLLYRFHKVISRYDDKENSLKNEVKAANSSPKDSVAANFENKKTK